MSEVQTLSFWRSLLAVILAPVVPTLTLAFILWRLDGALSGETFLSLFAIILTVAEVSAVMFVVPAVWTLLRSGLPPLKWALVGGALAATFPWTILLVSNSSPWKAYGFVGVIGVLGLLGGASYWWMAYRLDDMYAGPTGQSEHPRAVL